MIRGTLFFSAIVVVCVACSSTSSTGVQTGTDGAANTSCDDVCAHIESVCGQAPATCKSACDGWSGATRTCMGNADCDGLESCANSGPTADAGSSNAGNADQCNPGVKLCETRPSSDECTAYYAKSGYSLAFHCCGDADPGSIRECQGPIAGGFEGTYYCCKP